MPGKRARRIDELLRLVPGACWRRRCSLLAGIVLLTLGGPTAAQVAQAGPEPIVIISGRPLSDALWRLQEACRCVITYEDPVWQAEDIEDATSRMGRTGAPLWVPRSSRFELRLPPEGALQTREQVEAVAARLIEGHNASHRHAFRLERGAGVLHVVPVAGSVLQGPVTVEGLSHGGEIAGAIDRQLPPGVGVPSEPWRYFDVAGLTFSARQEPANRVLTRLLALLGRKVTWRLNYSPQDGHYYMNFSFVDDSRCSVIDDVDRCTRGDIDEALYYKEMQRRPAPAPGTEQPRSR